MLSVDDEPESEAVARSTNGGVEGATTSTTSASGDDGDDVLVPTVAVAVMLCRPAASVGVSDQAPDAFAVTVPRSVAPS